MSKNNELLPRARLDGTGGRMSRNETTQNARMLREDELDAVSGGLALNFTRIPCKDTS